MTVRKRVVVRGVVQGVFFRDATCREARLNAVSGWVRNRPDGSVEAVFEGEADAVDAMVEFCHVGPSAAVVTSVNVTDEPPEGLRGFAVTY